MSRKAYFVPVANSQECRVALDQLHAADIQVHIALVGPQLSWRDEPQGTPLADGQYCYLAITSEGSIWLYTDNFPALLPSFRLDDVPEELLNEDCSVIGATYLDEAAVMQHLAGFNKQAMALDTTSHAMKWPPSSASQRGSCPLSVGDGVHNLPCQPPR